MCQSELTEFLAELTEFAAELSEFSLLKTVLSKQYSARSLVVWLQETKTRGKNYTNGQSESFKFRVFLNPWFGESVVCTLDSRGFRPFRGFRDFRKSSTQLLVCSCLSCLRHFRHSCDFRRSRERRPTRKP